MITIQKASITDLTTDAIVNAANTHLKAGSGVCGAIFSAAGKTQLQAACDAIGYCPVGSAVITPGFNTHSKYIIHAVGPKWNGGDPNNALYSAYKSALKLATEYGCASIGFPLISAGVYGYPVDKAWQEAVRACREFPDLQIVFAIRDDQTIAEGKSALAQSTKPRKPTESLTISGKTVDAIFFHKTTEPNGFLCNWYPSPFTMDGITFNCVEQYMMYQKAVIFRDSTTATAILAASDPSTQKKLGRSVSGYDHNVWAGMRQMVVLRGLMAKFGQNERLKDQLLATGDAYLVEASKHDRNWGIGVDLKDDARKDASNWQGSNLLGFALMEVRRMIR